MRNIHKPMSWIYQLGRCRHKGAADHHIIEQSATRLSDSKHAEVHAIPYGYSISGAKETLPLGARADAKQVIALFRRLLSQYHRV